MELFLTPNNQLSLKVSLRGTYPQRPVPVSSNLFHTGASDVPQATARKAKRRVGQSFKPQSQLFLDKERHSQLCVLSSRPTGRNMGIEADGG